MTPLLIIGAGGHGRVVAETAELCGHGRIAFLDGRWPDIRSTGAWPVIGKDASLEEMRKDYSHCFVAIGDNTTRLKVMDRAREAGYQLPLLVHPSATVSKYAKLEEGGIVCAGAVAGVFVKSGRGVILNTGCTVDHDCLLGDGVHVSPGAHLAGGVHVGGRSWIGIGASVIENTRIGSDVMIGAGASVTRNIPDAVLATGVPARTVKKGR